MSRWWIDGKLASGGLTVRHGWCVYEGMEIRRPRWSSINRSISDGGGGGCGGITGLVGKAALIEIEELAEESGMEGIGGVVDEGGRVSQGGVIDGRAGVACDDRRRVKQELVQRVG
jgi:hypothetical protein